MRETNKQRLFIVLGMHRSGTSAITRGLAVLGVELGDRMMPSAVGNNAKGFWEDIDLNALNIEMLKFLGSDWAHLAMITSNDVTNLSHHGYFLRAVELMRQKIGASDRFGFKDPRVAKLLPFWREVFAHCGFDVSYIFAIRHPLSVVRSLGKRDHMENEQGYLLWLGHVIVALINSAGSPCVMVDYDRLMESPEHELSRVGAALRLEVDAAALQSYRDDFLDQELRHTVYEADDLLIDQTCPRLVHEVYSTLLKVAYDKLTLQDPVVREKISSWFGKYEQLTPSLRLADKLYEQHSTAAVYAKEQDQRLEALQHSADLRETRAAELEQLAQLRETRLATLEPEFAECAARVAVLESLVADRDAQIVSLAHLVAKGEASVVTLEHLVAARDAQIVNLMQLVETAEAKLASLAQQVADGQAQADQAVKLAAQHGVQIADMTQAQLAHVQQSRALAQCETTIAALRASHSWRLTAPLRFVATQLYRVHRVSTLVGPALRVGGGPGQTARRALRLYRNEGWVGVRRGMHIAAMAAQVTPAAPAAHRSIVDSGVPAPVLPVGHGEFDRNDYTEWVRRYDTLDAAQRLRIMGQIGGLAQAPLISVLMPVYNAPPQYLAQAIESVRAQLYGNWELCIVDDASTAPAVRETIEQQRLHDTRIKVLYRQQNGHISASSNSALEMASGEFVVLLDHDDLLAETALYRIVEAINATPDAILIYSDEDKVDAVNRRYDPYFKSDFNYELLLAQNMISHLGAYRTATLRSLGGFRLGFEGAQDYDLALRVVERATPAQIVHVPYVLYHWRAIAGSTALAAGEKDYAALAGRQAVAEHLARSGIAAEVLPTPATPAFNRVRFACQEPQPLVSILIPTRDRADLLGMCLDTLIERSTYANYEVIIIDNGSVEQATRELFARLPQERFKVIRDESPFNFSALNNLAARAARGQFLCMMNNDIEILTPDWLEEMVALAARPEIGCVGASLWYPDGRLQHGGVVLGIGGIAGHAHKYMPRGQYGYFGRAVLHQSYSAVTAACLLVRREIFDQVGGLDEQLVIAFNDIDFCLRVRAAGYRNVWTPYAEMVHHESASRGEEDNPEKIARFGSEMAFVEARWGEQLRTDPAYNPNLTLVHEDYSLAWPPRLAQL